MARSSTEVELSLRSSIAQVDSEIDTEVGPIPDVFIIPQAAEFSAVEAKVDDLGRRYSVDYVATLGRSDVTLFGANHGIRIDQGGAARGFAVYFRYARPQAGRTYPVNAGSVVSSDDGSLSYVVTSQVQMVGDNADVYYNSTRRRYEIQAPIQALGIGEEYAVPPGRIRNMATPITGFDGVTQLTRVTGGSPTQSSQDFMNLVRSRLEGSALGGLAGLDTLVRDFGRGDIKDVSIVFSTDVQNFRRRSRRAACDLWIIGSRDAEQTDAFTVAATGVASFVLTVQPVKAVLSVAVNGVAVPFDFALDTDPVTLGSVSGQSRITLLSPALGGDVVSVRYLYNELIVATQTYVDGRSTATQPTTTRSRRRPRLYELDVLVREATAIPVNVDASVTILSSYGEQAAQSAAINAIKASINTNRFEAQLMPDRTRSDIAAAAIGVSETRLHTFTRSDRSLLRVEAVEFRPFEYPIATDDSINVSVRTA